MPTVIAIAHVAANVGPNIGPNPNNEAYLQVLGPPELNTGGGVITGQEAVFAAPSSGVYQVSIHVGAGTETGPAYTSYCALHLAKLESGAAPPWKEIDAVQNYTDPSNTQLVRTVALKAGERLGFRFGNAYNATVKVSGTVCIYLLA